MTLTPRVIRPSQMPPHPPAKPAPWTATLAVCERDGVICSTYRSTGTRDPALWEAWARVHREHGIWIEPVATEGKR